MTRIVNNHYSFFCIRLHTMTKSLQNVNSLSV